MEFNTILLAAGYGERLRPLTNHWPKCLMPVHGLPLMEYWLSEFFENDCDTIFVNTCYLHQIVEHYLQRDRFKGRLKILREENLLGTGGTILSIKGELMMKPSLIVHADNWCGMTVQNFLYHYVNFRPSNCLITMMTFGTDTPETCGIVETNQQNIVTSFHEKKSNPPGNKANAAVYLIEPEVIEWMNKKDVIDFSNEVIPNFIGRIYTIHNSNYHRDIGTIKNLKEAQNDPIKSIYWEESDCWLDEFAGNPIHEMLS